MLRSDCGNSNVIRTTVKPYYAVTSKPSARTIWLCLSCTPFIPVAQIPGTTQGQTPQTSYCNLELSGSSCHQGQLQSAAEMLSVALRSLVIT